MNERHTNTPVPFDVEDWTPEMGWEDDDNEILHEQSLYNYDSLEEKQNGSCFYCLAKFEFEDIKHWCPK